MREEIRRRTAIAHSYRVGRGAVHFGGGAVVVGDGVETHVLGVGHAGLELGHDVVDAVLEKGPGGGEVRRGWGHGEGGGGSGGHGGSSRWWSVAGFGIGQSGCSAKLRALTTVLRRIQQNTASTRPSLRCARTQHRQGNWSMHRRQPALQSQTLSL